MPEHSVLSEEELAKIFGEKLGRVIRVEEVDDFLHEELPYEQRIGMHDVINCPRCRKETKVQ